MFKSSSFVLLTLFAGASISSAQITIGLLDNFEDGLNSGWGEGGVSPNPPTIITDGGPAGVGDDFLQNISDGVSAGGRLVFQNNSGTWTGDYFTAGVSSIQFDAINSGGTPVELRFALRASDGSVFASTTGFTVAADSTWRRVSFDLTSTGLTLAEGSGSYAATLASVTTVRIVQGNAPSWRGVPIVATVGIDNLTLVAVPEPAMLPLALALLSIGMVGTRSSTLRRQP